MRNNSDSARRLRSKLRRATALLVWLMLSASPAFDARSAEATRTAPKRVLLLHDYGQEAAGRAILDQGFQTVLRSSPPGSVEFFTDTLELYRFPGESHVSLMRDYLRQKYAGTKIDVIVVVFDAPLEFLLRHRDELFPGVPIVHLLLKRPDPSARPAATTGFWEGPRVRDSLDIALKLHPDTEQVFVISGRLNNNDPDEHETLVQLKELEDRVTVHYLTDLPINEITARVKNLPERSIVICPRQNIGVGGRSIPPFEAAALIAQSSDAPVYGIVETWVGGGIVGGKVVSLEQTGVELAKTALRVADGTRPEEIPVAEAPTVPMFDWRQLRRFHISEDRLPSGSQVRFKELTFWEQYKWYIVGVLALCAVEALLIAVLLIERRRRQRAREALDRSNAELLSREEVLRVSQERYLMTTVAGGVGVWDWDLRTGEIYVDPLLKSLLGYEKHEVRDHMDDWARLVHPEDRGRVTRAVEEHLAGRALAYEVERRMVCKDGGVRWFLARGAVLGNGGGGPARMVGTDTDITERRRVEEALSQTEELNRRIIESSADCIKVLDLEGRLLYMNPGGQKLMEICDINDHLHMPWPDFWEGEHREAAVRAVASAKAGKRGDFRGYCPTARGTPKWWDVIVTPVTDTHGHVVQLLSVSRDITESVRAEEALRESNEKLLGLNEALCLTTGELELKKNELQLVNEELEAKVSEVTQTNSDMQNLMASTDIGTIFLDRRLRIKRYTPQVRKLFNILPDDLNRPLTVLTHGLDYRHIQEDARRVLTDSKQVEREVRSAEGHCYIARLLPYRTREGKIDGVVVTFVDITERKRAEESLRSSEERYRSLVSNFPNGAVRVFDGDLRYVMADGQGLIAPEEAIIGKTIWELFPLEVCAILEPRYRAALAGATESCEITHLGRTYSLQVVPIEYGDSICGMTVSQDITDRKRAEEELQRLTIRLFNIQDEERRRIARELHDVTAQNLFAITLNLARLQEHDAAQGPEVQRLLKETASHGEDALRDIRTLSYLLHPPLLDHAGLVSALQWYVEGFSKRSGIYVDLIVLREIGRLPREAETALFRVVQESLTNIHRHSGSDTASIRLTKTPGEIVLRVKDSGRGMQMNETSGPADSVHDLGVGIPGMRQRLRQLGGRLGIESSKEGTTVTAVVPLAEEANHGENPAG